MEKKRAGRRRRAIRSADRPALERVGLRVPEAADALGISRSKAYELIASGKIPTMEIGGIRRVPAEWLRERAGAWRTVAS
jgi:excisionase family DNA binding protein